MAAGRLDVLLGLDAAEFTKGLTKAEYETRQFQERMVRNATAIGAAFKSIATGFVAVSIVKGFKDVVGQLDDLDEAAQAVGASSAVALANFRRAALDSGVGVEQLDKALTKLNIKMAAAASGDADAAQAFKTLGINVKDAAGNLRASDDVLKDVAEAFSKYRDGAQKSALAAEIFGEKVGPRMISLLNQGKAGLEGYNQVTQQTIDHAKELQSQFDKLGAATQSVGYAIVGSLAPALNDILDRFNRAIQATGDFDVAMNRLFLNRSVGELQEQIAGAEKKLSELDDATFFKDARQEKLRAHIAALRKELGFAADEANRIAQANTDKFLSGNAAAKAGDIGRGASGLPNAPTIPGTTKKTAAKIDENTQAYARYVDQLSSGLEKEQELSKVQEVTRAIEQNRFGELIPQQKELLLLLAAQADATEEYAAKVKHLADEERAKNQAALAMDAKIDSLTGATADREALATLAELDRRLSVGTITLEQYTKAQKTFWDGTTEGAKAADDATEQFGLTFASAIGDFITNPQSGKTFFQALLEDLLQLTTQMLVVQPIAKLLKDTLSGMTSGGGGYGDLLSSLFGSGGGQNLVGVFAGGTDYVSRDGLAMVHRGEKIVTAQDNASGKGGGGMTLVLNQSFAPGTSRETVNQAAAAAAQRLQMANRRNN
jgi:hypothetical protein